MSVPLDKINYFINRARKSSVIKGFSFVFVVNVISKVATFFIFVLLARQLPESGYGRIVILLSLITTVSDISALGLNASLTRYSSIYFSSGNSRGLDKLVSTTFINILIAGFISIVIVSLLSTHITFPLFKEDFSGLIVLSSFGILTVLVNGLTLATAQGLGKFNRYFINSLILSVVKIACFVFLILADKMSLHNIIIIFIVSPLIPTVYELITKNEYCISLKNYSVKVFKETFAFGRWITLWTMVYIAQSRLDAYLIPILTNTANLAYYDIALKFAAIPMLGFGAYATVLNPRLSSITDKARLLKEIKRSKKIIRIFTLIILLLIPFYPATIELFFGLKYSTAILPLRIMLFSLIFYVWAFPYNSALYALGKSKAFFISSLGALVINLLSSLILIPKYHSIGAASSYLIVNTTALLFAITLYRYYSKDYFSDIIPYKGKRGQIRMRLKDKIYNKSIRLLCKFVCPSRKMWIKDIPHEIETIEYKKFLKTKRDVYTCLKKLNKPRKLNTLFSADISLRTTRKFLNTEWERVNTNSAKEVKEFYDSPIWIIDSLLTETDVCSVKMRLNAVKCISIFDHSKVLDYGGGFGIIAEMAGKIFPNSIITLYEISRNRKHIQEKINMENVTVTNKLSSKYDVVISTEVLEHVHNPIKHILKMKRLINKGGGLILTYSFNDYLKCHLPENYRYNGIFHCLVKFRGFEFVGCYGDYMCPVYVFRKK